MPQQGLPFPTSNNAPLPIPGGYGGNYSGLNFGAASPNTAFNFPAYGNPVQGVGGQGTPFPAYNSGPYNATNLGGLSAGITAYGQGYGTQLYNDLGKAYGKGAGQLLGNLLSGQLYNPAVAAAYLNAQQPGIARGEAGILGAFGDAGARFSSAAATGLGDYESQVQLNQQQMLAQLYQHAQDQELNILQGVLPTLQQEQANKGSWIDDVIGGLEIAGGIGVDALTAGLGGNSIISSGVGMLNKGLGGRGAAASPAASPYASPFQLPGMAGNTGAFGVNAPSINNMAPGQVDPFVQPSMLPNYGTPQMMQASGGNMFSPISETSGGAADLPFPIDAGGNFDINSLFQ